MLEKLSNYLKLLGHLDNDLNNFAVEHPVFASATITVLIAVTIFVAIWAFVG